MSVNCLAETLISKGVENVEISRPNVNARGAKYVNRSGTSPLRSSLWATTTSSDSGPLPVRRVVQQQTGDRWWTRVGVVITLELAPAWDQIPGYHGLSKALWNCYSS